jgi:hypothetical protein
MKKELNILLIIILAIGIVVIDWSEVFNSCKNVKYGKVVSSWRVVPEYNESMGFIGVPSFPVRMSSYTPEKYKVSVMRENKKGKQVVKTFYITRHQWDTIQIGDYISTVNLSTITH